MYPWLQPIRSEWEEMLRCNKPVHIADITGREVSTICRRLDRDDHMESFPLTDGLAVIRALRKEQPGLVRAVIDFITANAHTTQNLDVRTRLSSGLESFGALLAELAAIIPHSEVSERQVASVRREWAETMRAMIKILNSLDAAMAKKGGKP